MEWICQLNWNLKLNFKSAEMTAEKHFNTEMNSSHEKIARKIILRLSAPDFERAAS